MTAPARLKDLADVLELIKALQLPREFAAQLKPYVRSKFEELWNDASQAPDEGESDSWMTNDEK